jgi:hypothetical protein
VRELGGEVEIARELPAAALPLSSAVASAGRRARRSRLAYSSGVLGIVAAACLVGSPLLLVALSIFGELLGETFAIILLGLIGVLITFGGGLAVCFGGVSLLRLARRDQTATGTGWAITGLCTGALPLLLGFVGMLSLAPQLLSAEIEYDTHTASATGPAIGPDGYPLTAPTVNGRPVPISVDGRPMLPVPVAPLPAEPKLQPAELPELKSESQLSDLLPSAPGKEPAELED